jgi:hypothetical protein
VPWQEYHREFRYAEEHALPFRPLTALKFEYVEHNIGGSIVPLSPHDGSWILIPGAIPCILILAYSAAAMGLGAQPAASDWLGVLSSV